MFCRLTERTRRRCCHGTIARCRALVQKSCT